MTVRSKAVSAPMAGLWGYISQYFFMSPFGSYSLVERFSGFSCFSRWLDWTGWPYKELPIQLTSPLRSASQIRPSLGDSAQVVSQMYATHQEFDWCPEQTAPSGLGSNGFPVALWLEILIKCLNDFPVLSFSLIPFSGGQQAAFECREDLPWRAL